MQKILNQIPEADFNEAHFLGSLLKDKSDEYIHNFLNIYRSRRINPQNILLTALLGLIWVSGIHRFMLNQIGMGLLYLFTGGLCFVGTILDLINHKNLAFEYNQKVAQQTQSLMYK